MRIIKAIDQHRLRLNAYSQAMPAVMEQVRALGSETWRNMASRTLLALNTTPKAVVAPICNSGHTGSHVSASGLPEQVTDLLRSIAAAILVGGQPITIMGVRFEDPRAQSNSTAQGTA